MHIMENNRFKVIIVEDVKLELKRNGRDIQTRKFRMRKHRNGYD